MRTVDGQAEAAPAGRDSAPVGSWNEAKTQENRGRPLGANLRAIFGA
jgi:hypothetical protein